MTKLSKSLALLCAAAPLAVFAADSTNSPVKPAVIESSVVIAKGKDISVTRTQLDDEIVRTKAVMAAQGRTVGPEETPMLEEQVLDKLISQQLLLKKATADDRAKGKADFEKTIQKIKANAKITEEQYNTRLNQQLRLLNLTKEEWEKQNAEQATIPIVLARELKVNITDDDAKKFYDENITKFEQPETVRAAHILLMTSDPASHADLSDEKKAEKKKQIEALLKRAKAGEDFGKLAAEFSEDPGSKDNGGEYTFPHGQMVKEFEDAAFGQGTNQVSDVITTQFGYHIIKTYEKNAAKKLTLADKVPGGDSTIGEAVKESLTQQTLSQKAPDYLKKLRTDAGVEILDEKMKAAAAAREKLMEGLKDADVPTLAPSPKK
ncbi:MAG: peptidylprolyl isomerase [Verrucomicrobiota bacterium]